MRTYCDGKWGNILITDDIDKGVKDSDVIYTDVWVSMGEPDEVWQERLKLLKPYQVNQALLEKQAIQMLFLNIVYLLSTMQKLKLVNKFMKNMALVKWKSLMMSSKAKLL